MKMMKRMGVLLLAGLPGLSQAADGAALYRQHCVKCHGSDGRAATWRGYLYFARDLAMRAGRPRRRMPTYARRLPRGRG